MFSLWTEFLFSGGSVSQWELCNNWLLKEKLRIRYPTGPGRRPFKRNGHPDLKPKPKQMFIFKNFTKNNIISYTVGLKNGGEKNYINKIQTS